MTQERLCGKCGTLVREGALEGLCGRCLGKLAFETGPEDSGSSGPSTPSRAFHASFGDYEVLGEIARGGMGVVYKARQISLNRFVALKMILNGPFPNPEFIRRFQIEAQAAAQLDHPGIVTIYEVGEMEGHRYLAMEFIDGQDFVSLAREKPLPPRRAAEYVKFVAEAIHYAHGRGIIHRDLKPSNLLLDAADRPRVTDFGIAKLIDSDASVTMTGQTLGSPAYMAPERAVVGQRDDSGPRGDIYSLGAVFYYLLTCRPPYQGETLQDILLQIYNSDPVPLQRLNPGIPEDLETICLKCLNREPSRRYATAAALAEDLDHFLSGRNIAARPPSSFEKFLSWCRSRPIQAALSAALLLAIILGITGVFVEWRRAAQHASGEETQRKVAEKYATRMRLELYAADINLVAQAIERGDYGLARSTLARLEPKLDEPDLRGFEWRYLANIAKGSQLATLAGHSWIVTCAAFSPDGKCLATGSQDGTCKIWDVAGKKILYTLPNEGGAIWSVAFTPDGSRLMLAGNDRHVEFWDLEKRSVVLTIPGQLASLSKTSPVVATADSSPFYWERAGTISLWNYQTGEKLRQLEHPGRGVALSADARLLAVAQPDHGVEISDAGTGKVLQQLETSTAVWSLNFSPDNSSLVTAGWGSDAKVWRLGAIPAPQTLIGHQRNVWSASYAPDGSQIITTGSDQTVRLWDAATLQPGPVFRGHGNEVWCAAFAPDGKMFATGGKDQMVMLWSAGSAKSSAAIGDYQYFNPCFSTDGRQVAVKNLADDEPRLEIWDMETQKLLATFPRQEDIEFMPDGNKAVVLDCDKASLNFWSSETGARETVALEGLAPGEDPVQHGFSSSRNRVFTISRSGLIRCWDTSSGKLQESVQGPQPPIRCAALDPTGRRIAVTLERENPVSLYDLSSEKIVRLAGHRDFVGGMAFSPDGALLATASMDGTIKLWNCDTAMGVATLPGHLEETTGVAFSPDGLTLASVARGDGIKLWHLATFRELVSIDYPNAGNFIKFTSDGTRLAVTTLTDTLHFIEAPNPSRQE